MSARATTRRSGVRRVWRAAAALAAGTVLLTGCDFDVYQLPLPGGPNAGDDPITVTAEFADVLDLVPLSTVKVDDVTVGEVTDVTLDGYTAVVTMSLDKDVALPENTMAEIRQTSLLGEKFVSLSPPPTGATGELGDGEVIPLDRTGRNPEVEEVLGALSLVLNGGGVAQLKTIATELNKTLSGREDSARSVLRQINTLVGTLDGGKNDIVSAIEQLDRLARTAQGQQSNINLALKELPSALTSLDQQRADLVKMLQALNRLGDVGVRVIKASKADTIKSIRQLQPVLSQLASSGDSFVKAFNVFLTYPFVDEVVGRDPQVARNLQMGDYTNLSVQFDLDLTDIIGGTSLPTDLPTVIDPTAVLNDVLECIASGDIASDACVAVLNKPAQLAQLREECAKDENKDKQVCKQLNLIPGLPTPSGSGNPLPSVTLPSLPGVLRPGVDVVDPKRGPTMAQLTAAYDPALVNLLIPGMVVR